MFIIAEALFLLIFKFLKLNFYFKVSRIIIPKVFIYNHIH